MLQEHIRNNTDKHNTLSVGSAIRDLCSWIMKEKLNGYTKEELEFMRINEKNSPTRGGVTIKDN